MIGRGPLGCRYVNRLDLIRSSMVPSLRLSQRVHDLRPSPIREILAVIDRPGMISFAGGLPAAASFPRVEAGLVPREFLQYGPSEGEPQLRQRIAEELREL